jgi:hypothetical protein
VNQFTIGELVQLPDGKKGIVLAVNGDLVEIGAAWQRATWYPAEEVVHLETED